MSLERLDDPCPPSAPAWQPSWMARLVRAAGLLAGVLLDASLAVVNALPEPLHLEDGLPVECWGCWEPIGEADWDDRHTGPAGSVFHPDCCHVESCRV